MPSFSYYLIFISNSISKINWLNVFTLTTPPQIDSLVLDFIGREPIKPLGHKCTKKQAKDHQTFPQLQIPANNFIIRAYVLQTTGASWKKRLRR